MQTDVYTKAVLGLIAASLVVLAARGLGLGTPREATPAPAEQSSVEPYKFQPIPMMRVAFRIDARTGETWWMNLPKGRTWIRVAEPGEVAEQEELPEPAPALEPAPGTAPDAPAPE